MNNPWEIKMAAILKRILRFSLFPAFVGLAANNAHAQTWIRVDVANSPALISALATADANPTKFYDIWMAWRRDAAGNTITWMPTQTLKLTKGTVNIHGSGTNKYPERYVIDGQNKQSVFSVAAAAGYSPSLLITGVTIQNGYSQYGAGGGLYSYKASGIQLNYCRFLNNRSNQNGSGISINETNYFTMVHVLVDGNSNDQIGACGGGLTAGGGGIAITNSQTIVTSATIDLSTISNNKACRGGGMELWGTINLDMHNTTISGNEAVWRGGGLFYHGGYGQSYIKFCTISNNKAGTTPVYISQEKHYAGGMALWGFNGKVALQGTVLAKNKVVYTQKQDIFYAANDCYYDGGQFVTSPQSQGNVIGEVANCSQFGNPGVWGMGSDNAPFDPKLGVLGISSTNDGFALPVQKPTVDSPLRGNFFNSTVAVCPATDERGFNRPNAGSRCDIGSVEFGADGGQ
jgi:hypothetical protein